jgi:endonuclease/exonuclease/phosphatase family protein
LHDDVCAGPEGSAEGALRSYNIEGFPKANHLELVAQVIEQNFDVVALQEVMTREAVQALVELLPGWTAAVSDHAVGRSSYKEFYAVLYRAQVAQVLEGWQDPDPRDAFEREPFVACLRAANFDFCVVSIHVVYGDDAAARSQECAGLGTLVGRLRDERQEKDWIVVGDFNLPGSDPCWSGFLQGGWRFTLDGMVPTSLGTDAYKSAYDHVLVAPAFTGKWTGGGERVDTVTEVCGGELARCRKEVSDHAPVVALFRTEGPDDD